jgi:hypothetical protein
MGISFKPNQQSALGGKANQLQIDVLCLTETNMKWNPEIQQIALSLAQKNTNNCQMSTSSHNGFSFGLYQLLLQSLAMLLEELSQNTMTHPVWVDGQVLKSIQTKATT